MTDWVFFSLHYCWGRQRLCCKSRSSKYTEGVADSWIKMQIWRAYFKRCELSDRSRSSSMNCSSHVPKYACAEDYYSRPGHASSGCVQKDRAWIWIILVQDSLPMGNIGTVRPVWVYVYVFWLLCMSDCDLAINNRPTLTFDIIMALTRYASNDGYAKRVYEPKCCNSGRQIQRSM